VSACAQCVVLIGHRAAREKQVEKDTEHQQRDGDHAGAEEREPDA